MTTVSYTIVTQWVWIKTTDVQTETIVGVEAPRAIGLCTIIISSYRGTYGTGHHQSGLLELTTQPPYKPQEYCTYKIATVICLED